MAAVPAKGSGHDKHGESDEEEKDEDDEEWGGFSD
jgi:putative methyltransferase